MRHEGTKALYQHWHDICRGTIIPDRNDLEPAQIGHLLRDVFILGADSHGNWRYRVAGTRLAAFAGHELRDEKFESLWCQADRPDALRLLSGVAHDSMPIVMAISANAHDGKVYPLEGILLPLRHGGKSGLRMIGGLFPSNEMASRLGLRIVDLKLLSLRTIDPKRQLPPAFGVEPDGIDLIISRRSSFRVIDGGLGNTN